MKKGDWKGTEVMYKMPTAPGAHPDNVVKGEKYRITVLADGLFRLEYDETGVFEDRATQVVFNRDFAPTEFTVKETEEELQIFTTRVQMNYNKKEVTPNGLSLKVRGNISNYHSVWHYGEETEDLGGTARTLDGVNGACPLEHGLMSRCGFSVLDDSKSLILKEDGWVEPRRKGIIDIYFFGYGHDYLACLDVFYHLCGKTPMVPRYALGNWWSRYYEYSEQSYMELMNRFEEEQVPFTVAVIDMDWHIVHVDEKYGSGWTGYTWNKELFPDPERFLSWLHARGMKTTLNVHPADGVQGYEDAYPEMAKRMGVDARHEEPVNFDISSPEFLDAYFDVLHHPLEKQGVDFWWIDWQQGKNSKIDGLDPLWMLNHYHYLDNGRDGKRPMTFSRYAGPGSHRYPLGFSGDTVTTWQSLDFQPYFTNSASNIGYGWWSHDIGGHMHGYRNDELMVRWLQYGVFSPINRLHSTKNPFWNKEPWEYDAVKRDIMDHFLRLRHQMIPYLYTMNYRAYKENRPIVLPMYYFTPEEEQAYAKKNQYWFGTELIVAPITEPKKGGINAGSVDVWLPKGTYIDLFTGMVYRGGRTLTMYRDISTIPVLAKAGAILPLTDEIFGQDATKNPASLDIRLFAGADGAFTLYEDENDTESYREGRCVTTDIELHWEKEKAIVLHAAKGDTSLIPPKRTYRLELVGGTEASVAVFKNEVQIEAERSYDAAMHTYTIALSDVAPTDMFRVAFGMELQLASNDVKGRIFDLLKHAEIEMDLKMTLNDLINRTDDVTLVAGEIAAMVIDEDLKKALFEILLA